VLSKSSL